MKPLIFTVLCASILLPAISMAAGEYTPIKPYSSSSLPGNHRAAGYGASHKSGVYTKNGKLVKYNAGQKQH